MSETLSPPPASDSATESPRTRTHVFVTVGSTQFDSLVQAIFSDNVLDALRARGYSKLVVQAGNSKFDISRFEQSGDDLLRVAVISGVLASLDAKVAAVPLSQVKWESHTPGTTTPQEPNDDSLPSRFLACVTREESARKLKDVFSSPNALGYRVEVLKAQNLQAVQLSDVILLW